MNDSNCRFSGFVLRPKPTSLKPGIQATLNQPQEHSPCLTAYGREAVEATVVCWRDREKFVYATLYLVSEKSVSKTLDSMSCVCYV